eukprot:9261571-Karenia_brevis.AAC.1
MLDEFVDAGALMESEETWIEHLSMQEEDILGARMRIFEKSMSLATKADEAGNFDFAKRLRGCAVTGLQ